MARGPKRANVGALIKAWRGRRGLTQAELGALAGVSAPTVSDWERGDKKPTTDNLLTTMEALGVTPAEFFAGPPAEVKAS